MYASAAKHDLNSLALRRPEMPTRKRRIRFARVTTCIAILRCGIGVICPAAPGSTIGVHRRPPTISKACIGDEPCDPLVRGAVTKRACKIASGAQSRRCGPHNILVNSDNSRAKEIGLRSPWPCETLD